MIRYVHGEPVVSRSHDYSFFLSQALILPPLLTPFPLFPLPSSLLSLPPSPPHPFSLPLFLLTPSPSLSSSSPLLPPSLPPHPFFLPLFLPLFLPPSSRSYFSPWNIVSGNPSCLSIRKLTLKKSKLLWRQPVTGANSKVCSIKPLTIMQSTIYHLSAVFI